MGNRRSASGWKKWEKTTKSERREIARNHAAIREGRDEFKKHPTELRCPLCGKYVEKLQQVRRSDLVVVPGCAACAKQARESAVLPAAPRKAHVAPASPALERSTIITLRRPAQDDLGALGLLMRSAFVRSGDLPLLPAVTPIRNADFRPIRRQLALMVGARPRYIPSGPVMAMGPGDKPNLRYSPSTHYQRQRGTDEFCASHSGGGGFIRFDGDYHPWSWVRRNCVCAHCGARPSLRRSKVQCFGHYRGATYFQCDGAEHHLFERESDLAWRDSRTVKDEAIRAWEQTAVEKAFHWFYNPADVSDVAW